jgi:hypothetical protein
MPPNSLNTRNSTGNSLNTRTSLSGSQSGSQPGSQPGSQNSGIILGSRNNDPNKSSSFRNENSNEDENQLQSIVVQELGFDTTGNPFPTTLPAHNPVPAATPTLPLPDRVVGAVLSRVEEGVEKDGTDEERAAVKENMLKRDEPMRKRFEATKNDKTDGKETDGKDSSKSTSGTSKEARAARRIENNDKIRKLEQAKKELEEVKGVTVNPANASNAFAAWFIQNSAFPVSADTSPVFPTRSPAIGEAATATAEATAYKQSGTDKRGDGDE